MANVSTNLLKFNNLKKGDFYKIFAKIDDNHGVIYTEEVNDNKINYISNVDIYSFLSELSSDLELKFECINYDTSMGYANKSIFDHGYDIDCRSISYGMDMECELMESCGSDEDFFNSLKEYINKYGENKSEVVRKGDSVLINEMLCKDEHVFDLLEKQKENTFKVVDVDYAVNGVWIEDFDCRIDIDEIIVLR